MSETSGRSATGPIGPGWAARLADRLARLLPGTSLSRVRDVARSTFWLVPALCVAAAIGLAAGLIALDQALPVTHGAVLVFPGPPEGARSFLSSIIQAMISFTGLVFSITIVVLQLSSGQFSPRVLRMFLSDRTIRFALGVFVATFVYAMVVLRAVRGTNASGGFVPRIAVTVAFGFVLASVALFIRYISHVANMIRVATVIAYIGRQTRQVISARCPASAVQQCVPALPAPARTIAAPRAGVLVSVNEERLVRAGAEAGCVLAVVPRVGDFVAAGAPLVTLRPGPGLAGGDLDAVGATALSGVALDTERSMEQDVAFGFRQLTDIAERALSPAVNDPTTAVQAIDVMHDLLRALATRPLPAGCWRDGEGLVRLVVPQYRYADLLDLAAGEIWHYGAGAAQVPGRLAAMLDDLHTVALPTYQPAIAAWTRRVTADQHTGAGA
jgi:uncharacterized membrane protein